MGQYGTDQIIKVSNLLLEMANVSEDIKNSSGTTFEKLKHASELYDEVVAMGDFSFEEMKKQFGELDSSEKAVIMQSMKDKLDLEDDILEERLETGFDLIIGLADQIEKIRAFVSSLKA